MEPMPYGNVLLVDEMATNLYIGRAQLEQYELDIELAFDGNEAIEKVKIGNVYDVIFIEHMMAKINGVETAKRLREMGYTEPIVAVSGTSKEEFYLKNGFNAQIQNFMQPQQLDKILVKFVMEKQPPNVIKIARQMSEIGNDDFDDEEDDDEYEEVTTNILGGRGIEHQVKESFVETQKGVCDEIAEAIEADDFRTAHRLAHTLKGLAQVLNEQKLAKIAYSAEHELGSGVANPELLAELKKELAHVISKIENTL